MPFQPSPNRDDGYDISDYYGVDPRYGTLGEFVEFTHGAKQRGIRVIDRSRGQPHVRSAPVVSGGAAAIPTRSIATGTSGRRRSPRNAEQGMVFPGVQKSTWSLRRRAQGLVLPPLLRLPARSQHRQSRGAGGDPPDHGVLARSSASPASAWTPCRSSSRPRGRASPSRASSTTCCARCASSCSGARRLIMLAEANMLPDTDMQYFGDDGDRLQMMFNFQVNQHLFYALASADAAAAGQGAGGHQAAARDGAVGPLPAQPRRARPRPADRRAARRRSSPRSGPTRTCSSTIAASAGASRRCSTATAGGSSSPTACCSRCRARRSSATATSSAWATICGCPSATAPARRCSGRTSRTAGFTKSGKPMLPVISGGPYGYEHLNEAIQRRDPESLLNWTERIIRMRKEVPEIGWGDFTSCRPATGRAGLRYEWRNNSVLVRAQFRRRPREITFSVGLKGENEPHGGYADQPAVRGSQPRRRRGQAPVVIEPYGYRWYRVGGLDYLLRRTRDRPADNHQSALSRASQVGTSPAKRGRGSHAKHGGGGIDRQLPPPPARLARHLPRMRGRNHCGRLAAHAVFIGALVAIIAW